MRFYIIDFTEDAPRKGKRIPMKTIKYDEQRDGEAGYGRLPQQDRQACSGSRVLGMRVDVYAVAGWADG